MSTRKPKQAKTIPLQNLDPRDTDGIKAGEGMSPAEAARASLPPSGTAGTAPSGGTLQRALGAALRPR